MLLRVMAYYILMLIYLDKEVHDAMKACLKKTHTEIYGCNKGFDEWCHPDTNTAERVAYTQQKFASLRNRYMAQHPNALDPVEERKKLLAAQGQLTQKKVENELRGELISLTQSFEQGLKQSTLELNLLIDACSLAGFKLVW